MFDASYDPATGVITLTISGFHDVADIAERQNLSLSLVARAKREFGRSRMLILGDGFLVQGSDVMQQAAGVMDRVKGGQNTHEKVALVLSSALVRLQLAKLFKGDHARIFASVEEASAWLLADNGSKSAAA